MEKKGVSNGRILIHMALQSLFKKDITFEKLMAQIRFQCSVNWYICALKSLFQPM